MSDFFVGQVMPTGFAFAPKGFALCNGQVLPIAQNQALFSLLGTQFGGDGVRTFMLPDLRGRTPIGSNGDYPVGAVGGVENVSLTTQTMPPHLHLGNGTTAAGTGRNPLNSLYGAVAGEPLYAPASGPQVVLNPGTLSSTGGSQPHPNMQPFGVLNFCIALTGVFPPRN
ncbi:phage tail protein [Rhodanobacter glycinis]|jgi:microcystin-dependent protein|uniref:Microcystin-dependent protein n=1 Tax=Rhodanobacter glycinis TaxID=582702 RepID=A0A1I4EJA4_9GAMM|nr:tail fiber protein [Rhodanobacter glycinis]SFL05822.1 Microcystin-dependent protein [Rhodanobacter glycinis]